MLDFSEDYHSGGTVPGDNIISVGDLTRCIRGVIEAEDLFRDVWVRGEISNLVNHSSGHRYFSLKDDFALLRCIIWGRTSGAVRHDLKDGMSVLARGRITVYEKQGQYQFIVSEVVPDGAGNLYLALEQLKAKLKAEGLFDEAVKKPIPPSPQKIAILTSATAAALRDMVTIAHRRMPSVHILLVATLMQGTDSEASVVQSLRAADSLDDIDVIVLGRGGGSIEDLWTFNSEAVVRAIRSCSKPVVSAIGHETDYTLADFAADLRAPTPSAAMELLVPEREDLAKRLASLVDAIQSTVEAELSRKQLFLNLLCNSPSFKYPERMLIDRAQSLDFLAERMQGAFRTCVSRAEGRLAETAGRLQSLSPLGVLSRGYGIVSRLDDGRAVRSIEDVTVGDSIRIRLTDGDLVSEVSDITKGIDR